MQKVRLGAAGRGAAPLRAQLLQAVAMGGVAAAVCDGPLSAARSRDPLLCTPMPIDGVLCNEKLLNAVLHGPRRSAGCDVVAWGPWAATLGSPGSIFPATAARSWAPARLGPDEGKYSFRRFDGMVAVAGRGPVALMARCTNTAGVSQALTPNWNPGGFMRACVETTHVVLS